MAAKDKPRRGRQRPNGEGTILGPRKDGRYVGAFYAVGPVGPQRADPAADPQLRPVPRGP